MLLRRMYVHCKLIVPTHCLHILLFACVLTRIYIVDCYIARKSRIAFDFQLSINSKSSKCAYLPSVTPLETCSRDVHTQMVLFCFPAWLCLSWVGKVQLKFQQTFTDLLQIASRIEFQTNHVPSFTHHFLSLGFPDSWHRDHPVDV